ncbi:pyruvate, phosphate dikinase [Pseudonocardia alni]|uniref:pyruvate, phosphate dikinase n=1 Tax=Pseudonocardia alni TaxID=33907 RepID=UPI00332B83F5
MTAPPEAGTATPRLIETFESADPDAVDRLGGKGAGLARMTQGGLRVPPGFVIATDACRYHLAEGDLPTKLVAEMTAQLGALERRSGKTFGRGPLPLLLSVRSGAPVSMPGMMDTILNLGLDRRAAVDLAAACGDTRFVVDLVARFHAMYGEIVLGAVDAGDGVDAVLATIGPDDPPGESYDRVWAACEKALDDDCGESVPSDPSAQLLGAVEAVFRSWNTRRARAYREHHGIPHDLGTAVVVQTMVFGNTGQDSGSGVVFTRSPVTGEPGLFGEYLAASQGEDVVAGTRTPDPVATALPAPLLEELTATARRLETEYGDVLDIEFTVERGILYFLQVRGAKRTPEAAVRIAADLLTDGTIPPATALRSVSPDQVRQVQRPGFDPDEVAGARAGGRVLVTGIGACPGQVTGVLVLDPDRAQAMAESGTPVVLARAVTSPADLHGMIAAEGIVTATGGATSHAAVVARALGTCCVVGAADLAVDPVARSVTAGGRTLSEGDRVSLDGSSGELFVGGFATATPAAASSALSALLTAATAATGFELFAEVSRAADVGPALDAGATGLLLSLGDLLVAGGGLDRVVEELLGHHEAGGSGDLAETPRLVAAAVRPFLDAAGGVDVVVRGLDLSTGLPGGGHESDPVALRPQLALALGSPTLMAAQAAGLAQALDRSIGPRVGFLAPGVCDPAEAAALQALVGSVGGGALLTSPRSLVHLADIAGHIGPPWIDLHGVQAATFGVPPGIFGSPEPLDGYLERGLLGTDPRAGIDPVVRAMLDRVADAAWPSPQDTAGAGVRLTGAVSPDVVAELHGLGARRFAVEAAETRPFLLALGRAVYPDPAQAEPTHRP